MSLEQTDIAIIGAGAAGLFAAIWAGRTNPHRNIVILDGAEKPGAKILVSGGGRCNVTHDQIALEAYAGSSPNAIRKVLRRFDAPETIAFFQTLGVELKREETGKLFPTSDSARTVLAALLAAVQATNGQLWPAHRVETITKTADQFCLSGAWGRLAASHLIIATGGKSLPKSGSDGQGYQLVKALGHTITNRIFPALVPLTLPKDHFICALSGLTLPATLEVRLGNGKRVASFTNSTLCTHFGLSGPSVLDISRYWLAAQQDDPSAMLTINWWPGQMPESLDQALQTLGRSTPFKFLRDHLPERLTQALCEQAGINAQTPGHQLTREQRKTLAQSVTALPLPMTGNRGWNFAEVTAGGVPLRELDLNTMGSRVCPNLHLCGEICDVDGRIGGYNFQWAWASGYVAGVSV
ncbi:MAG: aminoacetone oxidase family FAD-binding enzyme [Chloroflexi bacterium]|nr:aminoacetone oxidase family FAD-binding enzyme [Chloroflexota bacterium]